MLYQFLKILVRIALKLFFKRIYISGLEHIKNDRPQLIASNHPSGFLEPLIMACFFPKSLHFLVRGDVFDKKWLRPLLISTNQIPIFRFKDGFSKLRENHHTMDDSTRVLTDNKNLLIFVEGSTQSIKKLRPLQKGIARIAFQAMEKNPDLNLEIVPVGINFTFRALFNDEVMLKVGKPILARDYMQLHNQDKNKASEKLLHETYDAMLPNIVHLDDQTMLPSFEELVLLTRKSHLLTNPTPVTILSSDRLNDEVRLASALDYLDTSTRKSISDQISKLKIKFDTHKNHPDDILKSPLNFKRTMILVLGSIPAFIGLILHVLPITAAWIFMRMKVKQREFKSSILFVVSLVFILLMYILLLITSFVCHWLWWVLPLIIVSGLWTRYYHRVWTSTLFNNASFVNNYSQAISTISHTYIPNTINY